MGVIKTKGNATNDVDNCQQGGTNRAVSRVDMVGERASSETKVRGGQFADDQAQKVDDAACAKERESERRKWIWQMGTIVFMGFSGLFLNAIIKPFATPKSAATLSIEAYCQEGGRSYSASQERTANSLERACSAKQGIDPSVRILTPEQ